MAQLSFEAGQKHRKETDATAINIPIPEGVVIPKASNPKMIKCEGVEKITQKLLNIMDLQNHFPEKYGFRDNADVAIPGTIIDLKRMGRGGEIVVLDTNLMAKRINKIVELSVKLRVVVEYLDFAKKTITRIEKSTSKLNANPYDLEYMREEYPDSFTKSKEETLAEDFIGDAEYITEQMGMMVKRMKNSVLKLVDQLQTITKQLDEEKVASVGSCGFWPVKTMLVLLANGEFDYKELEKWQK